MNRQQKKSLARRIGFLAAAMVLICTGLLIYDYLKTLHRSSLDKSLLASMEEAVKTDAEVAVELTAEREKQTAASLARDARNQRISNVLMVGAVTFLICMNWLKSLQEKPLLPLEKVLAVRDSPTSSTRPRDPSTRGQERASAPAIDLWFVDHIIDQEGRGPESAIPILQAIQVRYGYLPDEVLSRVCELTEITPAQIAGTSSFYSQFRHSPVGKHLVRICHGTACHVSGVVQIDEELRRFLAIPSGGDTDASRSFTLEKVACLGCCSLAPVMMIDDHTVGRLTPAGACRALHACESEESA